LSLFARMDDESSEDDLDYFVVLDLSAARSSTRVALTTTRGKRRVKVPKLSVGTLG
jgi:hypothetical protein